MTTTTFRFASVIALFLGATACEEISGTYDPNATPGDAATAADATPATDAMPATDTQQPADATPVVDAVMPVTGHQWHFRFTFPSDFMVASATAPDVFDARGNSLVPTCRIEGQVLDCTWREPADPPASRWSIHTRLNFTTPSTPEARTDFYVPGWWGTRPETPVVLGALTLVEVNSVRVVCDVIPNGLAAPRNGYNFGNCHLPSGPVADAGAPVADAGSMPAPVCTLGEYGASPCPTVGGATRLHCVAGLTGVAQWVCEALPVVDAGSPADAGADVCPPDATPVADSGTPVADVPPAPRNCTLPSGATCTHGASCVTGNCTDSARTPISVTCTNGSLSAPSTCPMTTVVDAGVPGTDMVTVTVPSGWVTSTVRTTLTGTSGGSVTVTCTNNMPSGVSTCTGIINPPFLVSTHLIGTAFPGSPNPGVLDFYAPGIWDDGGECIDNTAVRVTLSSGRAVSCTFVTNGRGGCNRLCR